MGWPIDYAHPMHIGNHGVHTYDHFRLNVVLFRLAVGTCWRKAIQRGAETRKAGRLYDQNQNFFMDIQEAWITKMSVLATNCMLWWTAAQDFYTSYTHSHIDGECQTSETCLIHYFFFFLEESRFILFFFWFIRSHLIWFCLFSF